MVPQPFVTGGNRSYLEFWTVTSDPRYLRYKTPTIFPTSRAAPTPYAMMKLFVIRNISFKYLILSVYPWIDFNYFLNSDYELIQTSLCTIEGENKPTTRYND
jgi:hypothetical protein